MRVAFYARVSTSDKDQEPETQLLALREFVERQGWETTREYVDHTPARDQLHRTAWRDLLGDASKRRFDLLLVWRMDRAFRSVLDAATTLEWLRAWAWGSGPTPSPGWTQHLPLERPCTTSPWHTPSSSGGSSGSGSRRGWSGPGNRAFESVAPG